MVIDKKSRLDKLRSKINSCQRCSLFKTRSNAVPGEGDINSPIMFIGEAPGRNEDLQGKPFVGRAGDIFDKLLESVNLSRNQIFLCNILKCRPPSNRNPLPNEIKACIGSLDIQLEIIDPKIICTLGNFAATYIFNKFSIPFSSITSVAGKVFEIDTKMGVKKVVPLFHPAVATYNPNKLKILLKDFKKLKDLIENINSQPELAL